MPTPILGDFGCSSLSAYGFPKRGQCKNQAVFLVWPRCEPQNSGYAYLCESCIRELDIEYNFDGIFQVNEMLTGEVVYHYPRDGSNATAVIFGQQS